MIIYKISNNQNAKLYIGQTIRTAQERFARHIQDAMSNRLDTHLARAIRKYGAENFTIEVIDTATSQKELDYKEHYWANYYDSINNGYNEVDPIYKCGGNTYQSKTLEELAQIKEKIRQTKLGGLNPQARKVKCKNISNGNEYHFNSLSEMQAFFEAPNHNFITRRCNHTIHCLYKKEWQIAYEEDEYDNTATIEKNSSKAKQLIVINIQTQEERQFPSLSAAERYYNWPRGSISKRAHNTLGYMYNDIYCIKFFN